MTSVAGLVTWQAIFFIYFRFLRGMREQGMDRSKLPYRAPLQPYLSYYGFVLTWLILITNGFSVFLKGNWDTATFVTSYIPIILFFILLAGHKVFLRKKWVKYEEMDFVTGNREGIEEYDPPPKNFVEK